MVTQVAFSKKFDRHHNSGHPENASRTSIMLKALKQSSFYDEIDFIRPGLIDEKNVYDVHSREMVERIKEYSRNTCSWLDLDTYVCRKDYETACLAAGGVLQLCRNVIQDKISNGFGLIRPPGHHATSEKSMGFCLLNNAAVAANILADEGKKIWIFDPDVHHGNGIQDIFYHRDDVLYQSYHLYPHFPGTGKIDDVGEGKGCGYNINAPLPYGTGETVVERIIDEIFLPIASSFNPDIAIICSGYDGHHTDRLGGLRLTANFYGEIIKKVQKVQPKIVCTLEGGYSKKWIGKCFLSQIGEMAGFTQNFKDETTEKMDAEKRIDKIKKIQRKYWDI